MELSKLQRIILFLLSLGLAVGLCSLPAKAADEPGYVLRSDVREVRLAFSVRDAQGRTVPDLRPADVAVADNGRIIRRFRSFRPASEAPLDVVILLDASDSVATHIAEEVEAVRDSLGDGTMLTGFYSYGEISPFRAGGRSELHNQTMTITTFAELPES